MLQKLKYLYIAACELGLKVPFAFDAKTKEPSFVLLCAYTTFLLTLVSVIALHFNLSLTIATITSMTFWVIAMIFYRIGNLSKAKFDLDDKSVDLEGESDNEKKDS